MGVKLKKYKGKWYLFIDHDGKRKAKCLGTDRKLAESIKRQVEAKLVLGGLGVFGTEEKKLPTFGVYADSWMKDYARVECKTSTAAGYEGVLRQYLLPRFANNRLDEITRDQIKSMINELVAKNLSRNTIRNALCVIRGMINQAIEGGLLGSNPASRLGRFTRTAKSTERKGVSLTTQEVQAFLDAASEICPEYYPLFLHQARGWIRYLSFAGSSGWSLTDAGSSENERRLAAGLDRVGARDIVTEAHQAFLFLPLNQRFGTACTDGQIRPAPGDPMTTASSGQNVVETR